MDNSPSDWMHELVEAVAECMESHSAECPVGWRYHEDDDHVDLIVYATPVELLGGECDGTIVLPGFSLDVQALESLFERVTSVNWKAQGLGPHDDEGPCLSIEGVYRGHLIWLRVLAEAPEDEEPGLEIDTSESDYTSELYDIAHILSAAAEMVIASDSDTERRQCNQYQ